MNNTPPTEEERTAAATMLSLLGGIHISRALHAVAELGIADLLADGPMTTRQLAHATATHEPTLHRIMRLLTAVGVFEETGPRTFGPTILGERLRTGVPASMRSWATLPEALGGVAPFAPILDTIKTGEPGFDTALGTDLFAYLRDHPDHGIAFDTAMAERTAAFAPSVAEAFVFSRARTVVDVGGGNGMLLAQILRQHPHLDGVLFDSPAVTSRPNTLLTDPDLAGRCRIEPGDFFDHVPAAGDVYVMANIIHDWDDTRAAQILRNCVRAMNEDGRVLLVERMIPDNPAQAVPALVSDINMLVLTGGRERTVTEYTDLLTAAGLTLRTVRPVSFPYGVLEATR